MELKWIRSPHYFWQKSSKFSYWHKKYCAKISFVIPNKWQNKVILTEGAFSHTENWPCVARWDKKAYIDFEYSNDRSVQKRLDQAIKNKLIYYVMLISFLNARQVEWGIWGNSLKHFYLFSIKQLSTFLPCFLLGEVSLLGPQSETIGVHQLCIWLSATNTSISLN